MALPITLRINEIVYVRDVPYQLANVARFRRAVLKRLTDGKAFDLSMNYQLLEPGVEAAVGLPGRGGDAVWTNSAVRVSFEAPGVTILRERLYNAAA